ncbi:MAG: integrase/recombinase XerC [Acidimicrobiaceae bacterium]|jgi:site-specific recombinase XerD|nr:integrase/recombinase XerC [Acidimicrobiaceae bacterium]
MAILQELSATYVQARSERGEISRRTRREIHSRLDSLGRSYGDRPIDELDARAIDRWQRSIGHHSPAARRAYLSTVKVFCRWLVAEQHLATDPTVGAARVREPRRVPRALSIRSVAAVLAAAADPRSQTIIWLMVGLGLRCCEVARLELGDWDREAATLHIRGKADNERLLPVPAAAGQAIAAYLDTVGWRAGPIVRGMRGQVITANALSVQVSKLMSAAGIKSRPRDGVSAHALRHTCASDVYENCRDLRTVQAMMGHASIATTEIYLRRADLAQMRTAMEGRTYGAAA